MYDNQTKESYLSLVEKFGTHYIDQVIQVIQNISISIIAISLSLLHIYVIVAWNLLGETRWNSAICDQCQTMHGYSTGPQYGWGQNMSGRRGICKCNGEDQHRHCIPSL